MSASVSNFFLKSLVKKKGLPNAFHPNVIYLSGAIFKDGHHINDVVFGFDLL